MTYVNYLKVLDIFFGCVYIVFAFNFGMKLLIDKETIFKRIEEIGKEISKDYEEKDVLCVGILKGCTVFMAHLLVNITGNAAIDFMTVSSYRRGTESEDLHLLKDLDSPVEGKNVLLVEDIIDTGKTVHFVKDYLYHKGAASVEIVSFVDRKTRRRFEGVKPKYACFQYDDDPFLIGFGFDFGEKYRNLPAVYQLEEKDK